MTIPTILTLPARIDSDLGRPKIEEPSADRERDLSGAELNRIQYWIATLGALIGKTDGSDAGSMIARIVELETGAADPDATVVERFDDLDDTSAWVLVKSGTGSAGMSESISPGALSTPFPSRGVFSLQIGAGAGIVSLYRPLAGMMHSATQPIVVTWRTTKVIDNSLVTDPTTSPCAALWGMAGGFSLGVPTYGVFLAAMIDGSTHRVWKLAIYSGGVPTYTALTTPMPSCTWFEVRITADAAHVKIEVSPEGGAWVTLINSSSVAAPDGVYVPYANADYSTGVGSAKVFLDSVRWRASREVAHAGSTVPGTDFQSSVYTAGTGISLTGSAISSDLGYVATSGHAGYMAAADKTFIDRVDLLDQWWKFSGVLDGAAAVTGVYLGDGGGMKYTPAGASAQAANVLEYTIPAACTLRDLRIYAPANTLNQNVVVTVYKNGVATTITTTVTASTAGAYVDTTHTVSFAAGDRVSIFCAAASNGTGAAVYTASLVLRRT